VSPTSRLDQLSIDSPDLPRSPSPLPDGQATAQSAATAFEVRRSTHGEVLELSVSLAAEYSGLVPAGTVIGIVARARERMLTMGVRAGLVVAVESMARARLARLCPEAVDWGSAALGTDEPTGASLSRGRVS
jgi:hypothetical protein